MAMDHWWRLDWRAIRRRAVGVGLAMVTILTAVAWAGSQVAAMRVVTITSTNPNVQISFVWPAAGRVRLLISHDVASRSPAHLYLKYERSAVGSELRLHEGPGSRRRWDISVLGLEVRRLTRAGSPYFCGDQITIPYWLLLAGCATLPVCRTACHFWCGRRRMARLRRGMCEQCGYDLRGSPEL